MSVGQSRPTLPVSSRRPCLQIFNVPSLSLLSVELQRGFQLYLCRLMDFNFRSLSFVMPSTCDTAGPHPCCRLPPMLPSHCACGKPFDCSHAMSCPTGELPTIRHNELCDLVHRCWRKFLTTSPQANPGAPPGWAVPSQTGHRHQWILGRAFRTHILWHTGV